MLKWFDTLLTRIVILVAAAVLSTFVLVYFIVQFQMSAQNDEPRSAISVALTALLEAKSMDWPDTLSSEDRKRLKVAEYAMSPNALATSGAGPIGDRLLDRLDLPASTPVRLSLDGRDDKVDDEMGGRRPVPGDLWPGTDLAGPPGGRGNGGRPGFKPPQSVIISIAIAEDRWVNLRTEDIRPSQPRPGLLPMIVLVGLMVGIGIWAALNAINPLRQMARAADTLAADYKHAPLHEEGPSDVKDALRAFNRMGQRLETVVSGQRQLLAAIGHDLRTPITSLKLKVEMLADAGERERMSRALAELERITEAALSAATAGQSSEPFQPLDIHSLVDSLVEDLTDLGQDVRFDETDVRPIVLGRSDELTRALRNILENAVRYGDRATVSLAQAPGKAVITVRDEGPGIPEEAQARVFEPLVRLEESRNRETGGHGLGLHIAKTLIEAHSGGIALKNGASNGLEVLISLPLKPAAR